MRGGRPVETILGQEGFSRLARRSISVYEADRLQPGPATGTPRRQFLEGNGSSPLSESVISRYAGGGAAAASMSSSAQRCRKRPLAKCTVESDTAPRLPSACGSGPDGNPPTEGVRRPGGSGLSRGFAVRGHAAARASDTPIRPVHSSSRQAHRSSAPRAPADRIGDQCQGHGDGCTAARRAPFPTSSLRTFDGHRNVDMNITGRLRTELSHH